MGANELNYQDIKSLARSYYRDLPYHNFSHALNVMQKCQELIKRSNKYRVKVNEDAILIAALFHDAGYADKTDRISKEEHSADIAEEELVKLGCAKDFIEKVKKTIISTRYNEIPKTPEEKILRAADLSGFAGDYDKFLGNNKLLKREYEQLNEVSLTEEEWKTRTKNTTFHYLSQEIRLTPEHDNENGESIFHIKTLQNIHKYLK